MRKGKKRSIFNEPILHIIVAVIGLAIIVFIPDADQVCEKYKRMVSIILDIGIGLFPTGLIGLILILTQKNQADNEKFDHRVSLLRELDIHLHNFLNEICRCIDGGSQPEKHKVKDLLLKMHKTRENISVSDSLKECAASFSEQANKFLSNKTDYLITEIFTPDEMDALSLLLNYIDVAINSLDDGKSPDQIIRCIEDMTSCLLKFLRKMPEFAPYLKLKFNGSHIQ